MKPILFNTEMVQAILEGRKTTTRRVIKDISNSIHDFDSIVTKIGGEKVARFIFNGHHKLNMPLDISLPYKVGDILYVRETWCRGKVEEDAPDAEGQDSYLYVSQCKEEDRIIYKEQCIRWNVDISETKWKPSIFMPKEVARIFLKVTNIKVERLQNIDYEGCKNEGVKAGYDGWIGEWSKLWDSTVNKKDLDDYGWDSNPYVWVIEFERISKYEALKGV